MKHSELESRPGHRLPTEAVACFLWPAGVASAERLSLPQLHQVTAGDPQFLRELADSFCAELDDCLQPLETLGRCGLRRLAHTLKASAFYVGAIRLSRMAEILEGEAGLAPWSQLEQRWISLQAEATCSATAVGSVAA